MHGGAKVDAEMSGMMTSENSSGREVELKFCGQYHSFTMPGVPPFHVIVRWAKPQKVLTLNRIVSIHCVLIHFDIFIFPNLNQVRLSWVVELILLLYVARLRDKNASKTRRMADAKKKV
jgi:hypothetical protein